MICGRRICGSVCKRKNGKQHKQTRSNESLDDVEKQLSDMQLRSPYNRGSLGVANSLPGRDRPTEGS